MDRTSHPRRLFVSYTGADVEVATRIADALRRAEHEVTIQAVDFQPGNNFVLEMHKALSDADHVVAVLSRAYEGSGFGSAEWAAAFAQDPLGEDRRLIGVRVEDYKPSGLLKSIVYVDLVGRDDQEIDELVVGAIESGEPITSPTSSGITPGHEATIRGAPGVVPWFTGRDTDMDAVSDGLARHGRVAITGFGGIGKTSLAAAWVRQRQADFDLVLWLHAPNKQRALEAAGDAARELGLVAEPFDADSAMVRLREHLRASGQALVVLDDCVDEAVALELFPGDTKLLVTSRNDRGWSPAGFAQYRVDVLDQDAAVEFLEAAAPRAGLGAREVAAALDGLPLALAQAAAYVDRHAISFANYLDRLASYAPLVFEQPPGHHYGHTVLSAWALALDELESADPAAAWILRILAFVDPRDFPRGALVAGLDVVPDGIAPVVSDPFKLDAAIAGILRQSLCSLEGDGMSLHPVIQGVIKSRLDSSEAEAAALAAVAVLRRSLPEDVDPTTWPTWERIAAHSVTAAIDLARLGQYSEDLVPLVTDVARFHARRGYPHYANYLLTQMIGYVEEHKERASLGDAILVVEELASSFVFLRAADRAEPLFRSLIELSERNGRLDSRGAIDARVGLASVLTDLGEHSEALAEISLAAGAFEGSKQDDPALAVRLYGTWGRLLVRMGSRDEGRARLEQALAHGQDGATDENVALTHLHLGNTYRDEPGSPRARACYERALQVSGRIPDGQQLHAEILGNLSGVLYESGETELALQHVESALSALDEVPEGQYTVTAAMLHFHRAQFRSRIEGVSVSEVVREAGFAFDVACDHLPQRHPQRRQVGLLLLTLAEALDDDEIRHAVWEREPDLREVPDREGVGAPSVAPVDEFDE